MRWIDLPSCEIRCALLSDGRGAFPVERVFEDVPALELAAAQGEDGFAPDVPYNCLLVWASEALVLVDTGLETAQHPVGGSGGELWQELEEARVAVGDIDIVVVTHGHLDHIGGLTKDGMPAFPRARYVISEGEWSFWTSASVLDELSDLVASPPREQLPPLEAAGVLERFSGEVELGGDVRLLPAPGHTPAHVAVEVGQTGGLLFAVDALLHPLQIEHPDWGRGLDHDAELAIESRLSVLARAAERKHAITASHWDTVVAP